MKKNFLAAIALLGLGIGVCKAQYTDLLDFYITNGAGPMGSLVISGNVLFGMTRIGGVTHDSGTIFSVHTDGS